MVARKTEFSYPSDQPTFSGHNPNHESSLIPTSPRPSYPSNYEDPVNPWSDSPQHGLSSDRPVPDILRPGSRTPENNANRSNISLTNVPNVLRAGQPTEDTPRSSIDSKRSKDFWEDSDDEQGKKSPRKNRSPQRLYLDETEASNDPWITLDPPEKSPGIKRKPVAVRPPPVQDPTEQLPHSSFASNNPFRRPSQAHLGDEALSQPDWSQEGAGKGKGKATGGNENDNENDQKHLDYFQGMQIGGGFTGTSTSYQSTEHNQSGSDPWNSVQHPPPMPQNAPPPPPPSSAAPAVPSPPQQEPTNEPLSPFSKQPPLIPVTTLQNDSNDNPWMIPSQAEMSKPTLPSASFVSQSTHLPKYNDDRHDSGQESGTVPVTNEQPLTSHPIKHQSPPYNEPSLLDDEDDDVGPPLPVRPVQRAETEYFEPPEGPPPPKPPRPTIRTTGPSSDDLAKMLEQRNETYQVKHFNWFDHNSRRLRTSSMLTQNKNGPCPLLALVNALILGAKDESQASLDDALRSREQVTLGLIIETLMDELLSRGLESVGDVLPDVDELNSFLLRLRTGMNANPRFVPPNEAIVNLMDADDSLINVPQQRRAQFQQGTFEATIDMKLYGAFNVPLVHGWLPEPGSDAERAFQRSAPTYEDAQALQFGEEELEYKLTNSSLTPDEQNMWQNIQSIKAFLGSYPTQLTPTGLKAVQSSIPSGSFAILFRNDHFSTIYKHPESGQLFTLITDAGYAERDEIIWESLVDITGSSNEFFSGDFMPVSHNIAPDESSTHPAIRRTSQLLSVNENTAGPLSPQEVQEQHDADFAMALQLQEEEEQRQRAERNRRRSAANAASGGSGGAGGGNTTPSGASNNSNNHRRQQGNIPIALRPQPEARPSIPARVSRANVPAVNRPADADGDDAPPAYEEAAKGRPYIPPIGSPLHPHSDPSPMNSQAQLTGTISNTSVSGADGHPPGPNAPSLGPGPGPSMGRRQPGRRQSAYNEQSQYYSSPQRMYGMNMAPGVGNAGPSRPNNSRKEDRDCIVM